MSAPFAGSLETAPWLQSKASQKLLDALSAKGHPVRFVGGCVRDGLLGHLDPKGDLDLATPARPDHVIALLEKAGINVVPTGLSHPRSVTARPLKSQHFAKTSPAMAAMPKSGSPRTSPPTPQDGISPSTP